jgi:hypothetical protein
MRQQERAFYLVWADPRVVRNQPIPSHLIPTFLHDTEEKATTEARRLAEIHGGKFYVVKTISATTQAKVVTVPCADTEFYDSDLEIPF